MANARRLQKLLTRIGTWRWTSPILITAAMVAFVACWGRATDAASDAKRYPEISGRPALEVIGWDTTTHRIYYVVTLPMYRTDRPPDSIRVLRYFEPDSGNPQEPRTLGGHVRVGTAEDVTLLSAVDTLRRTCVSLDTVGASGREAVRDVGHHEIVANDVVLVIYHLLVRHRRWSAEYQTYAECNSLNLVMRAVYAVPGRAEAIAIIDRPHSYVACDVSLVMLLSEKPLPVREHDLSQLP